MDKPQNVIDIEVKSLGKGEGWIGTCKNIFDFVRYGETKLQVIDRMRTALFRRGFELGNLPEVMGIEENVTN